MVIQVGNVMMASRFVNKQAIFICELVVEFLVMCVSLTLALCWIISFYRHCFFLVDSGECSHFKIVM